MASSTRGTKMERDSMPPEVFQVPDVVVSPFALDAPGNSYPVVLVGVLSKYVNLGKGWRNRLFVLDAGVLRYYKVTGPAKVDVYGLLENLRRGKEVKLLGSLVENLEAKDKARSSAGGALTAPPAAHGELHVQVSQIKQSASDNRKFYIHSGTKTLYLRAEAAGDQWEWVNFLRSAKQSFSDTDSAYPGGTSTTGGISPTPGGGAPSPQPRGPEGEDPFKAFLRGVQSRMTSEGSPKELVDFVSDRFREQHTTYVKALATEAAKRRKLLEYVQSLEDVKITLETQLVTQATQRSVVGANNNVTEIASDLSDDKIDDDDQIGQESDAEDDFFDAQEEAMDDAARQESNELHSQRLERAMISLKKLESGAAREEAGPGPGATATADEAEEVAHDWRRPAWLGREPPTERRTGLPKPAQKEKSVSLWSLIKECVGKDLTRICLPVYFNEPISALEKAAEDMEYCNLLDRAAEAPKESLERLLLVSAFAISGYAGTTGRTAKPFNPLLGETYELIHKEKGFRFISEKVIHHPTVFAAHAEGRGWTIDSDGEVKSKFWGRSIELIPLGICRVRFHDGDEYSWNKVVTNILNLIVGKLTIDNAGIMLVRCDANGLLAKIKFKAKAFMDKNPHQVFGHVEQNGRKLPNVSIEGKWDDALRVNFGNGAGVQEIWRKAPPAPNPTRYNLTQWCMQLNEITRGMRERLAPTDSRLRPDQQLTEQGYWDQANDEKQRLEKKQRAARKAAERGEPLNPRWFKAVPGVTRGKDTKLSFQYSGGYFEARDKGVFEGCRDIFGQHVEDVN